MSNVDKIMKSMYGRSFGESSVTRKFDIDKYPKMEEIVLEIINLNIEGEEQWVRILKYRLLFQYTMWKNT